MSLTQRHLQKPAVKPLRPHFSSGPCAKWPGWPGSVAQTALTGRSHRSIDGKARLKLAVDRTRDILELPPGYQVAIVPGSDTGAFEIALWNLLGPRKVDVFAWDAFGRIWLRDVMTELRLQDARTFEAHDGALPNLAQADFSRDIVLTWNGTTTGVRAPNASWIPEKREGLVFVDATSAVFAEEIDVAKIDVLSFSWQKVLGGEAAHGMLVLSPRAVERLNSYRPPWPLPRLFRLTNADGVLPGLFDGVTINTPSMLCVEDYLVALDWVQSIGGLHGAIAKSHANAKIVYDWIERTPWVEPLARDTATRSHTAVCMKIADPDGVGRGETVAAGLVREIASLLASEGAAFDISSYRGVTPGFRIWTGATVEKSDLEQVLPWLEWGYETVKGNFSVCR